MIAVVLPLPPNLGNARMHWAVKNKKRKAYVEACRAPLYAALGPFPAPDTPPMFERLRISMHFVVGKENDWDNIVNRGKWAWDSLVHYRIIEDDGPKYVDLGEVTQITNRKNQRRLVLYLEPLQMTQRPLL